MRPHARLCCTPSPTPPRTQAFPRWVSCSSGLSNCSGNPYTLPEKTASYVVSWVQGAKTVYDVDVDYIGSWVRGLRPQLLLPTHTPHARTPSLAPSHYQTPL